MRLDEFLPYRLSRLSEAVSREIQPIYKEMYGLTRPEWRVLAALAEISPATATELGAHSAQHKTKVSRAVAALEKRRWLTRARCHTDRRSERLALTKEGVRAHAALIGPLIEKERALLERLTPEQRDALAIALAAFEQALALVEEGSEPTSRT